MKIGIKVKLAAILSLLLFITTSIVGIIMITQQRASLNEQMRSMAGTITGEFASNSKMPFMQKDSLALNLLVQNLLKNPGITDAFVLDDQFIIEGHKELHEVNEEYYHDKNTILGAEGPPPWVVREDKGTIAMASPIVFKGTTVGYAVIFFSNDFINKQVSHSVKSVISIALLAIIVVSLSSIPMASGLLRPVFRLFKGTKEIAMGNFDYRIPEISKDEIGDLVDSFNKMASELKKKEVLKGALNRYVSPHVADEIFKEPDRIRLGGDRREVTVFFADIRGFTSLSRKMEPEETVEALNRYFTLITEIIFSFEGTVDKFIGDGVMAVFGAPLKTEAHLENAVKAAFAIKKALERVNGTRAGEGLVPLRMGMGLSTGEVIVGNMGSQTRMDYTAVGDSVNLASRLTDLASSGEIIVDERTFGLIRDFAIGVMLSGVNVKGFDHPLNLYNITGLKGAWLHEVEEVAKKAALVLGGSRVAV